MKQFQVRVINENILRATNCINAATRFVHVMGYDAKSARLAVREMFLAGCGYIVGLAHEKGLTKPPLMV